MRKFIFLGVLLLFVWPGCAQVPKESVELSVTVGRDLAEVHRSHREKKQRGQAYKFDKIISFLQKQTDHGTK